MLTGKQKRHLRSLAHNINLIFQIGETGINDNTISQIDEALENRELTKVHILQSNFDNKDDLAQTPGQATDSEVIQVIGSMVVIYRESRENKEILSS